MARQPGHARTVRLASTCRFPAGAGAGRTIPARVRLGRRASRLRRHARAQRRRTGAHWPTIRKSSRSAKPGWTTIACRATSNGSASVFAPTSAPRARCGKPLIIHTRAASEDTMRIMREEGAGTEAGGAGGVMHCFTESLAVAEAAMEMGFYISFSGIVTFKSAKRLAGGGAGRAAGAHADRNRFAVPGAGAVPRQDERARIRAACRRIPGDS